MLLIDFCGEITFLHTQTHPLRDLNRFPRPLPSSSGVSCHPLIEAATYVSVGFQWFFFFVFAFATWNTGTRFA